MIGVSPLALPLLALDSLRRQGGLVAERLGLGPVETPWREAAAFPGARLRAYPAEATDAAPLLVLPAPFKRAYIWDLLPEVSVVRAAQAAGFQPYLLEWLDPKPGERGGSLTDYAWRLPRAAVDAVRVDHRGAPVHLIGHSLGGTFAAIFASLCPERVGRLGLIDAPLAFGRDGGPISKR